MKWVALVAVPLALAALGYRGWVALRSNGPGPAFASGNGRIEATEIDVAARFGGRVEEVLVEEGEFVKAGQLLARIGVESLRAQREEAVARHDEALHAVAGADAQVALRRADRAAVRSAAAAAGAARALVDAAQAAIAAARTQVTAARSAVVAARAAIARIDADLAESELKAPRDGRVQYRVAEPGEVLAPGGNFDWLVAMDAGRVLATGTPQELLSRTGATSLEAAFIALLPEEKRRGHEPVAIPPLDVTEEAAIAIEAKDLTMRFGEFVAVDHVSFRMEPVARPDDAGAHRVHVHRRRLHGRHRRAGDAAPGADRDRGPRRLRPVRAHRVVLLSAALHGPGSHHGGADRPRHGRRKLHLRAHHPAALPARGAGRRVPPAAAQRRRHPHEPGVHGERLRAADRGGRGERVRAAAPGQHGAADRAGVARPLQPGARAGLVRLGHGGRRPRRSRAT